MWMALNTFKCNYLPPLHFKGLTALNVIIENIITTKNDDGGQTRAHRSEHWATSALFTPRSLGG